MKSELFRINTPERRRNNNFKIEKPIIFKKDKIIFVGKRGKKD